MSRLKVLTYVGGIDLLIMSKCYLFHNDFKGHGVIKRLENVFL